MGAKISLSSRPLPKSGGLKDPDSSGVRAFSVRSQEYRNPSRAVRGSFKKGGKVKQTGPYELHRGERVLNKKQTKKYDKKRGGSKR